MTHNTLLTAICELIEDWLDDGFPASDVPNVIADIPAEMEGRAEQRMAATARMMKEAAR